VRRSTTLRRVYVGESKRLLHEPEPKWKVVTLEILVLLTEGKSGFKILAKEIPDSRQGGKLD
jgi:hypothetical protein